jgi:hypothetical protein
MMSTWAATPRVSSPITRTGWRLAEAPIGDGRPRQICLIESGVALRGS